jgi:hypothetical protein
MLLEPSFSARKSAQGVWTQLTPQASWLPRHGHRLVRWGPEGLAYQSYGHMMLYDVTVYDVI